MQEKSGNKLINILQYAFSLPHRTLTMYNNVDKLETFLLKECFLEK